MFLRQIHKNTAKLFLGNGFNAALGLLTSILCARGLGAESFGILVFIFAYEIVLGQLFSFNAWTAVVAFGSRINAEEAEKSLFKIIKVAFILDFLGAILGTLSAMALSSLVIRLMSWDHSFTEMLQLYCLVILFKSNGAPTGYLRLRQHFSDLAVVTVINAMIRFFLVAAAFLFAFDLKGFLQAYLVSAVIQYLVIFSAFLRCFGMKRFNNCVRQSLSGFSKEFSGFWSYVITSNLHATVKLLTRETDQLIIGAYVPIASLGLLKIARQSARVLPLAAEAAYQTIFSSLSQLWASGKTRQFLLLIRQASLLGLSGGILAWVIFFFSGKFFLSLTFGVNFVEAYQPALIYLAAMVIAVAGLPFQPAMLAIGQPALSFKINLAATIIYLSVLSVLTAKFSINGAAVSYVVYYLIWVSAMKFYLPGLVKNDEQS